MWWKCYGSLVVLKSWRFTWYQWFQSYDSSNWQGHLTSHICFCFVWFFLATNIVFLVTNVRPENAKPCMAWGSEWQTYMYHLYTRYEMQVTLFLTWIVLKILYWYACTCEILNQISICNDAMVCSARQVVVTKQQNVPNWQIRLCFSYLERTHQGFIHAHHSTCIIKFSTVIGCWEQCN